MPRLKAEVRSYPVIELKSVEVSRFVKRFQRQILLVGLVLSSSSVLLLSGCSSALTTGLQGPSEQSAVSSLKGKTHGGNFPVQNSAVQIYEVGATKSTAAGYGAESIAISGASATTDNNGDWNIASFTCANNADELYVVSSGGNPGLQASDGTTIDNSALVLTAALGPCSNVQAGTPSYVVINEITTVATEYSLAGFSTDYLHVGTSSTNLIGLTNAFATFNNLVDVTHGAVLTTTPAYATPPASCTATPAACTPNDTFRSIVPYTFINTVANILAGCVNTDGKTPNEDGSTNCGNLFALTGGSIATPAATITNTADATLYIAHNPGLMQSQNPGKLNDLNSMYLLSSVGTPPFSPTLSLTPTDFTMALNFVGGGLGGVKPSSESSPEYFAIDGNGNVWITNNGTGTVTELNNLGAPLSPSTTVNTTKKSYPAVTVGGWPGATAPQGIAIDLNGNAWVSDEVQCLIGLSPNGTQLSGSPFTGVCGGEEATGVAVDTNNNIWVALLDGLSSATSAGTVRPNFPITSNLQDMSGFLGQDYAGHMWFIHGHFGAFNLDGSPYLQSTEEFSVVAPYAAFGPLSSSNMGNGGLAMMVTQQSPSLLIEPARLTEGTSGTDVDTFPSAYFPPTLAVPTGIAADGNGNYYFSNYADSYGNTGMFVYPNVTEIDSAGDVLSPPLTGFLGGSDLQALNSPVVTGIDQSGNVWALNQCNSNSAQGTLSIVGGTYLGNGIDAGNVTEFVGLAAPVNPLFVEDAANQTYATKP